MSDTATTTLDGNGSAHRIGIPPIPEWWALAGCRSTDPAEWVVEQHAFAQVKRLRAICAGCPAGGACLEDAMSLDPSMRHLGLFRCGTTGRAWVAVEQLVAELDPSTPDEWSVLAAWCVDGDVKRPRCNPTAAA